MKALLAFSFGAASVMSAANDTALATGGTPRPLTSHASVSMRSEVVQIDIGEKTITVDCRFVFENHSGKAVVVRMGFPDQGAGASDPDEEHRHDWRTRPPRSTFDSFESWVNGRKVPTRLERSDRPAEFWHVKTVTFPAHRRTVVRDHYTQPVGFAATSYGVVQYAAYVLHTGSSWHGRIGRSEVIVRFSRPGMPPKLTAKGTKLEDDRFPAVPSYDWSAHKDWVFFTGPCTPSTQGRTLRFVRTHWRPVLKDDVKLAFDVKR